MATSKRSLADEAMQVAGELARLWFSRDDQRIADCISSAWELAQSGRGNPVSIAWYAVKRVRSGRHFRQSVRSIDHPAQRPGKPYRKPFDVADVARIGGNPSAIAGFRIDFQRWLNGLPANYRAMAELLASGETTADAAKRFGVSAARISQVRRMLAESWYGTFAERW